MDDEELRKIFNAKKSRKALVAAGFKIIEVDMSEFEKMDGGLTCLSLRMPQD